jgi:polyferredoxin
MPETFDWFTNMNVSGLQHAVKMFLMLLLMHANDVPNVACQADRCAAAAAAGWLLVLITSGAVACSVLFERRLWCRYLCPIGKLPKLDSTYGPS